MGSSSFLNISFLDETIPYDGSQLAPHWILKKTRKYSNGIVAFIGPADVAITSMVDLEDVLQNKPIYSENMLHFVVELFDVNLREMILIQHLFISIIRDELSECAPDISWKRKGDDIFWDEKKLSVSIAAPAQTSCLIHTGLNISSKNTPVPTIGLEDVEINPHALATSVMHRLKEELEKIWHSFVKVRGV